MTSIGVNAFYDCTGLTSVTIPNSVTNIKSSVFYGCSGLTSVTIGSSVTAIDSQAFLGCSGLTSVTIPNSVTSIGSSAFSDCSGLTNVTIGNSVTSIGSSAFSDCSFLTNVSIPNSVTSIHENAFSGCTGLTSMVIPNSVTSIGSYAFRNCSGLTSVIIGNSEIHINGSAFYGCSGLTSIVVESGNTKYDSRNNCNAIIEKAKNSLIAGCKKTIIPNSVTNIDSQAFLGCSGLTCIMIPNSVTSIGQSAFRGCSGLTNVTIPNSVTSISGSAFSGCSGLTSITIPNSVTSIGNSAFNGCNGLTSVICCATNPPSLGSSFDDYTIPLYVPKGSVLKYKAAENWRNFVIIREISEEQDVYLSVRQVNGMVRMKVDAEKPYFNLQIKADEGWMIHSVTLNENDVTAEVSEDGNYTTPVISSDAVLNIVFEKGSSGIAVQSESPLRVLAYGNTIQVSGAETGEQIVVYSVDGKLVERVKAEHGTATITLPENQTYIVKGQQKTVKVRL